MGQLGHVKGPIILEEHDPIAYEALGSDFARRWIQREDGWHRTSLEAVV